MVTAMTNVYDELSKRGFIAQTTDPALGGLLGGKRMTVYAGFDPSAESLHIGHMVPILALSHFQRCGHRVLVVIGGATGIVGDPSGKSDERSLLSPQDVAHNVERLGRQMSGILDFSGDNPAVMLNNHDWIGPMSFIDWLRDVGKHFTVNTMIAKESVKRRIESEQGISFTEFSYMTMQAYDYLHLFDEFGCTLQCGATDQWGNITAGIDLVRRTRAAEAYGLTFPLLSTAGGQKMGKSEGNAIWIDPDKTSPYLFYQYWMQTEDADVDRFLRLFTFLDLGEIEQLSAAHREAPHQRVGQKALAEQVTRLVHGDDGLSKAQRATDALFGGDLGELSTADLLDIFANVPSTNVAAERFSTGVTLADLLSESCVCKSKSDARRAVEQGSIYLNNQRCADAMKSVTSSDLIGGSMLVLRSGKKRYHLVHAA